jgi:hypothetical protein
MQCKVFYSWQSDLPNKTNRGFIQTALENATKRICNDDSIEVEPVIDRDTVGVPGSPDISDTIFAKIEEAAVFVADVSIINQGSSNRLTPNPNVLVESGYALKCLGPGRVILVINTVYGNPETLPFDLRTRRVLPYTMREDVAERAPERRQLEAALEHALRLVLEDEAARRTKTQKTITPTAEEVEILLKTADSHDGVIHYIRYPGGLQLLTGTQYLIDDNSPRLVARWQAAFDHMLQLGLLTDNERDGERFHLSPAGFDAVDQIRQQQGQTGPDYGELEKEMPDLLAEMSEDLKNTPLIREFVILDTKGNIYNGDGVFIYYRSDHPQLDPKLHILLNHGLITDNTYNTVDRYRFTEQFVKYLKKRKSPEAVSERGSGVLGSE